MAWIGGQVAVTTSPQNLTTLLGLSGNTYAFGGVLRVTSGAATVYGGEQDVTNAPANAFFSFTATNEHRLAESGQLSYNTDGIYLVASAPCAVSLYLVS